KVQYAHSVQGAGVVSAKRAAPGADDGPVHLVLMLAMMRRGCGISEGYAIAPVRRSRRQGPLRAADENTPLGRRGNFPPPLRRADRCDWDAKPGRSFNDLGSRMAGSPRLDECVELSLPAHAPLRG